MPRLMAFIDGENLTSRFEAMKKAGRVVRDKKEEFGPQQVVHRPGQFAWSPSTVSGYPTGNEVQRVHYYTTFSGGADQLDEFREFVASQNVLTHSARAILAQKVMPLIPRVFHKTARRTKTKSVDINLCVDVLEYVRQDALDAVFLVTGDVDYLPLVEAVMRAGKQVYIAALSDGLNARLRYGADGFYSLDSIYFRS